MPHNKKTIRLLLRLPRVVVRGLPRVECVLFQITFYLFLSANHRQLATRCGQSTFAIKLYLFALSHNRCYQSSYGSSDVDYLTFLPGLFTPFTDRPTRQPASIFGPSAAAAASRGTLLLPLLLLLIIRWTLAAGLWIGGINYKGMCDGFRKHVRWSQNSRSHAPTKAL